MPATRPMNDLRKQAAQLIVGQARKVTFARAARELGISRQALYDIENGTYCPSLGLIQRACQTWDLQFDFRGLKVGKSTIRSRAKNTAQGTQLDLFGALGALEKQHFEVVRAKRTGRALELTFRLEIGA